MAPCPSFSLPFTRFVFLNICVGTLQKEIQVFCVFPQLETKFKDSANKTMMECEEPFRCFVKFSSSNLLESFRHCASSGLTHF